MKKFLLLALLVVSLSSLAFAAPLPTTIDFEQYRCLYPRSQISIPIWV